jgi:hypothetical protein
VAELSSSEGKKPCSNWAGLVFLQRRLEDQLRSQLEFARVMSGGHCHASNQLLTCEVPTLPCTFRRLFELGRTLLMLPVPISEPVHQDGVNSSIPANLDSSSYNTSISAISI